MLFVAAWFSSETRIIQFPPKVITTHHFGDIEQLTGSDWHQPTLSSCKVHPCVAR